MELVRKKLFVGVRIRQYRLPAAAQLQIQNEPIPLLWEYDANLK